MSKNRKQLWLVIAVLALGILLTSILFLTRKKPRRAERPYLGPLVESITVERQNAPVVVKGHGAVEARVSAQVVPQVSGRVESVDSDFVAGGRFRAGQVLFVIEQADFRLAIRRGEAAVARAGVALEQERAEAEVARSEWENMNPGEPPPSDLVIRGPQLDLAEAELEAARADLEMAKLNFERTRYSFPYDGVVLEESVDEGQFLVSGQPVGRVYSTRSMEIPIPLKSEDLVWIETPGSNPGGRSQARVSAAFGGVTHQWEGRLVRLEGQVDPLSRMVNGVVEVYGAFGGGDRPPLLPGTFVEVEIEGKTIENVVPIPRSALHDGGYVWTVQGGVLRIRDVRVVRTDRDRAYVVEGLEEGSRIVTTPLEVVTDGMKVRLKSDSEAVPGNLPSAAERESGHD
jgi:RND family efflux transporter MFP subunit